MAFPLRTTNQTNAWSVMLVTLKYLTVGSRLNKNSFHLRSLFTNLCLSPTKPNDFTHHFETSTHHSLHNLLEKCSSMRELSKIHAQILIHGLSNENLTLGKLISFCAISETGDLRYAQLVFDQIQEPNKFMYNSLVRGYSNSDDPEKSLFLYRRMTASGLSPNEFTLPFVLKVCAGKSAYWEAVVVHCQAIKLGIGSQVCVQNALMNVYVVCGLIRIAHQVFDEISERTLVSWNTIIGGYSRVGCWREAFWLFKEMRDLGLKPDKFTLVNLLSVCSQRCDLDWGRFVHLYIEITGIETDQIVRNALLDMYAKCGKLQSAQTIFDRMCDKNVVSWTSIVTAYAKNGLIESAKEFFDQMPAKNVISWNAMISCYVREGQFKEALDLFKEMHVSNVVPDEATLVCVLSACSQIGDLVIGKETHQHICNSNIALTVALSNSLIDMYAKCGALEIAIHHFLTTTKRNIVSWNVIIGALALHGCGPEAIEKFEEMQAHGILPDKFTFTGLLSACSHSGLVDIGRYYFDRMSSFYRISPELEHYACMVDLLGRGGLLEEAMRLIGRMPMKPDVIVWGALLGACRIHGNVEIGKQILKQLLESEPHGSGLYVLLSNIFCEAQRWEDVKRIRKLMKGGKVIKTKAISSIEIEGCIYEFTADDKRHQRSSSIYATLDQLTDHSKPLGPLYNMSCAFLDMEIT